MNKKIFAISSIVLIIDQIIKSLFETIFNLNQQYQVINNFFYITSCHNDGAAWGLFSGNKIIIIIFTIIALLVIYRYMYLFKKNMRNNLAFGLLIGGIIGNFLDRILFGYVRDFFDFYIFNYDYPVFNIADICIVVGIILLIIAILKGEDRNAISSKK